MRQVFQSLKNGDIMIENIPAPSLKKNHILIRTSKSLISTGTEKMLLNFGKSNYLSKALQQPEKVKVAINKIKNDGILNTTSSIFNKLNEPIPLGYCNVGVVIEVGEGVTGFKKGDRVVSNGHHAEIVSVPINLCAKIPKEVSDTQAVFTVMGAIGLQGIRLASPVVGEKVCVIGMGLIGLITAQILKAQGCQVLVADLDAKRLNIAKLLNLETINIKSKLDIKNFSKKFTDNNDFDSSIITASSNDSSAIDIAANVTRKRGRIILIGTADIKLSRDIFYNKELTFQVSCSYGPGRYDINYEEKGIDYPISYVRWTEKRNFLTVLKLFQENKINTDKFVTHKYDIKNINKAYKLIFSKNPSLGIMINYNSSINNKALNEQTIKFFNTKKVKKDIKGVNLGVIGAGNYAKKLVPYFNKPNVIFNSISSLSGSNSYHLGKRLGFEKATSKNQEIYNNKHINTVVVCTNHDSHGKIVLDLIKKNKNIYVEKPLSLKLDEINSISRSLKNYKGLLTVGFNRRFSPHTIKIKNLISDLHLPKAIIINVNAGVIDNSHWVHDYDKGGGRLIGEACHFIDLCRFLIGKRIVEWSKNIMDDTNKDTFTISLKFEDGSIGTINYFANGHRALSKERIEIYIDNKILKINNFKTLVGYGWNTFFNPFSISQNKGQKEIVSKFLHSLTLSKEPIIPYNELIEVAKVSILLDKN